MAVHPYPAHLVSTWTAPDGTRVTIRPIRPEDAGIEREIGVCRYVLDPEGAWCESRKIQVRPL